MFLETPEVTVELTATERCGFHKYTFPASGQSHIILDLAHGIGNKPVEEALHVESQDTVSGYRISDGWGGKRAIYFVMQFSKPFESDGIEQNGLKLPNVREGHGKSVKAFFNYKTAANEVVIVKVGISGTSIEGARKNLAAEIPGWDFDAVRKAAVKQWEKVFDAVQIKTFDPHIRKNILRQFILDLPRLRHCSTTWTEPIAATTTKTTPEAKFQNYTTFSIWDIFRAEWPLMTLLQPGRVNDIVQTMLAEYRRAGTTHAAHLAALGQRNLVHDRLPFGGR